MDSAYFKLQKGNVVVGACNNQFMAYNLVTKQTVTKPIDFPISNSLANAFPTTYFKGDYYCIPFDENKMQQTQKLYKMSSTQITEVGPAPSVDTFGYASTANQFLCFDWANKSFYSYENQQFVTVPSLNQLKYSRVHIAAYMDHFVVISWDNDSILLVNEQFQIVKTVKLNFNPFIDFWMNMISGHVILMYVREQTAVGRHILIDMNELFARELPNAIIFPNKDKFIFKSEKKVNSLRRPFVVNFEGQKQLMRNGELQRLDTILLEEFEGYIL
ncbi:Hypothetical_protein [Hexamita inflata]|uniref:Hypothetical_protein n=1 Tax=Hexamita inflata TaxID=28002 RepID=A0AA86QDS1_9EUKA|nr:Hypothetical protein HINF_LOCUS9312 [Hexamita inflata]CAI9950180.1 Hypothetical protein HINF_LOCUS37825 [Hexamita inflata]